MSTQNPILPTATDLKGIDATIYDIDTHLSTSLVWLTNGQGRAYKLSKFKNNDTTVFLPEVYLGGNQSKYFAATPDNDKKGQSIFVLGNETYLNYRVGQYGQKDYELSIIFSINLKLIDPTLLLTEQFARHQIMEAEEALTRGLLGKAYRLVIDNCVTEFDDVYSGFDVSKEQGASLAPMSYFRFNCTVTLDEDCQGVSLNRCGAILQNLSQSDICSCIIPSLDFSETGTDFECLSSQQVTDIIANASYSYTTYDGFNEYTSIANLASNVATDTQGSLSIWVNISVWVTNFPYLVSIGNTLATNTISLVMDNDTGRMHFFAIVGGSIKWQGQTNTAPMGTNTWHRVTFVQDGVIPKIYIDGVEISIFWYNTTDQTVWMNALTTPTICTIAARAKTVPDNFAAFSAMEFSYSSTALSAAQELAAFNLGFNKPDYSAIAGIVAHLRLDQLNPPDLIGANNGTSVNQDASNIITVM